MDYVVVDTSPLALVADTEELAQMTDASVLVVRQDTVLAKDINDAIDILNNTRGSDRLHSEWYSFSEYRWKQSLQIWRSLWETSVIQK